MNKLLAELNEPQREAVAHGDGPLLIFAGAGSGKTRTLTHRIAHLITERDVAPGRILAVTFTNKAAAEIRERLHALVGDRARAIWMGTFHAMCARMLRISGSEIGIDHNFAIFDSDDTLRLMKELCKSASIDLERYPPARILGKISDAKNNMRTPADLQGIASSPSDQIVARLYEKYQGRLRAAGALDFDDLLGEAVRLLREGENAKAYWSDRFLHVLVDEFQDVNAAQFAWAQHVVEKHRNICVVGDDDQSIYMWRGANVKIILDFEYSYPDATVIRLEQNYRSTQNILDAAHGVISRNLGRKAKRLWSDTKGGASITLQGCINAQEEAAWVIRQIQQESRKRDCRWSDFAVLCRVNAQSRPFEEAFMRARAPLRLVGTQRFYERKEIKDLISYLKVMHNPRDDIALMRMINVPARGIGSVSIEKLGAFAQANERTLFDVITDPSVDAALGSQLARKIAPLRDLLKALQRDATDTRSVGDLLTWIIERTDYLEYLRREHTVEGIDRVANVQELLRAAEDFDQRLTQYTAADDEFIETEMAVEQTPLSLFLEGSALEGGTDAGSEGDAVTFMTLHSAKGLEFPIVFLAGMEQGLLPHARALWSEGSGGDELEEERRLCYVGLTRAREQVFLTYAAQRTLHGRTETTTPSQFIDEIPAELVQRGGLATRGNGLFQASTSWSESRTASTIGAAPPEHESTPPTFEIGARVRHPTFGEGLVVNCSSNGGYGEWVEVAFLAGGVGKKKLIVAYAPLERA